MLEDGIEDDRADSSDVGLSAMRSTSFHDSARNKGHAELGRRTETFPREE